MGTDNKDKSVDPESKDKPALGDAMDVSEDPAGKPAEAMETSVNANVNSTLAKATPSPTTTAISDKANNPRVGGCANDKTAGDAIGDNTKTEAVTHSTTPKGKNQCFYSLCYSPICLGAANGLLPAGVYQGRCYSQYCLFKVRITA